MSARPVLVTCGLPYTNGPCHFGHLRTYVPADFYVRYLRRTGEEVVFICGSVDHGTPIVVSAEDAGISPRALSETLVKQRRESIEQFEKAQRQELAAKERQEIEIIESYLPKPLSSEELETLVTSVIADTGSQSTKDMGAVMKAVMARLGGQPVDGKHVSELVKRKLS